MQTLSSLAPFVPLLQTLLWVFLILGVLIWFRSQVRALLDAIRARIERGSALKAGPFELSELKPQTAEVQKAGVEAEAKDALATAATTPTEAKVPPVNEVRGTYLLAETLALRAVQAEFGVPLTREVSTGISQNYDAVFVKDRNVYVVEVKLVLGSVASPNLAVAVERVSKSAWQLAGPNARLLLVIVYSSQEHVASNVERVSRAASRSAVPVELRNYTLAELQRLFGAGDA